MFLSNLRLTLGTGLRGMGAGISGLSTWAAVLIRSFHYYHLCILLNFTHDARVTASLAAPLLPYSCVFAETNPASSPPFFCRSSSPTSGSSHWPSSSTRRRYGRVSCPREYPGFACLDTLHSLRPSRPSPDHLILTIRTTYMQTKTTRMRSLRRGCQRPRYLIKARHDLLQHQACRLSQQRIYVHRLRPPRASLHCAGARTSPHPLPIVLLQLCQVGARSRGGAATTGGRRAALQQLCACTRCSATRTSNGMSSGSGGGSFTHFRRLPSGVRPWNSDSMPSGVA